jgi:hypothetical protein
MPYQLVISVHEMYGLILVPNVLKFTCIYQKPNFFECVHSLLCRLRKQPVLVWELPCLRIKWPIRLLILYLSADLAANS